jgi:hypothetical protein
LTKEKEYCMKLSRCIGGVADGFMKYGGCFWEDLLGGKEHGREGVVLLISDWKSRYIRFRDAVVDK